MCESALFNDTYNNFIPFFLQLSEIENENSELVKTNTCQELKINLFTKELNESKKDCINVCNQLYDLIEHNKKNELQLELEKNQHHDSKEEIKYLEKELAKSDEHTKSVENELISSQFANNQLTFQIERLLAGSKNHTTMNLNLLDSIFILPINTEDIHIPAKSYIQQVTEETKLFQVPKTVDIGVGTGDQLMF